jgi:hypothetical protein
MPGAAASIRKFLLCQGMLDPGIGRKVKGIFSMWLISGIKIKTGFSR